MQIHQFPHRPCTAPGPASACATADHRRAARDAETVPPTSADPMDASQRPDTSPCASGVVLDALRDLIEVVLLPPHEVPNAQHGDRAAVGTWRPNGAPHLWCICVKPMDRVVRTRESHAPLGALRRGQMRQETSTRSSYRYLRAIKRTWSRRKPPAIAERNRRPDRTRRRFVDRPSARIVRTFPPPCRRSRTVGNLLDATSVRCDAHVRELEEACDCGHS